MLSRKSASRKASQQAMKPSALVLSTICLMRSTVCGSRSRKLGVNQRSIVAAAIDFVPPLRTASIRALHVSGLPIFPPLPPRRVQCSTGAKIGTPETWNARIDAVRKGGTKSIAAATMERWFTASFREREPQTVERIKHMVESTSAEGFIACCEALREADFRESISAIRVPTLVISGTHDSGTPPADGKFLAKQIAGARYVELDAAHLLNIEQRDRFTQGVSDFLREPRVSAAS